MSNHADFKVKHGLVVNTTASFLSTVTSTSTTTGGVIVSGGVGIAQDVYIGGNVNIRSITSATSTSNGALHVEGGVGIGGDLYARNIYQNGVQVGFGGGSPSLVIQDEGVALTTVTSVINFVGFNVAATLSAGTTTEVTVTIPDGFPTGDYGLVVATTDAFGVSLDYNYDLMNPSGYMYNVDLGALP